jgi:hypothetical protein
MTSPSSDDNITAWEQTITTSLQTRKKLAELMDQIDETVIVLRAEVEHARIRRGNI